METSDADLVRQALSGDKAAFGALVQRHRPMAARLAGRMLADPAAAEDVAQEACLYAFLELGQLRQPERFAAWLYGIAVNLCRLRLRLRMRRVELSLDQDEGGWLAAGFSWADAQPTPEASFEIHELHQLVLNTVAILPVAQQSVVRLYYLDGLSLLEIGRLAGVPVGTVKARLSRARRRLRAGLAREFAEHEPPELPREEVTMVEMIVHDVMVWVPKGAVRPDDPVIGNLSAPQSRRTVLLKERAGERIIPIWIGPPEASDIARQLAGKSFPRPMTFDLMARLLEAGHVTVERAAVSRLHENTYYGTLWVRAGDSVHEIDARPSDMLSLALRVKAPIFASEDVLAQAGLGPDKLQAEFDQVRTAPRPELDPAVAGEPAEMEWRSLPAVIQTAP
jgi:RNA polymerase sigma factor (sigma-70 family)